jgi:5-methylcytosine-specific restriction endonuclease McrA
MDQAVTLIKMLVTPHAVSARGYFEQLQTSEIATLRRILVEITTNPRSFFSFGETSYCSLTFQVITETETLSSERDDISELDDFISALGKHWRQATITLSHGIKTTNVGLKLGGAHKGQRLTLSLDNEEGMCQIAASFQESCDTHAYILRLANALSLSAKPKKASRYIPEPLETKLLCDSMHLCNVCKESGVIIHHIIPVEEGGQAEEENLVVLCPNHHRQAHSKSILARDLRPEHLREYKHRHLKWVAARGASVMPIDNEWQQPEK